MADGKDLVPLPLPGGPQLGLRTNAELIARGRAEAYSLTLQAVPSCLARAKQNGKWGFIDKPGRFAIAPIFDCVGDFCEGLARASVGGKYESGYIDKLGKFVVEPRFHEAGSFVEGLATVTIYHDDCEECEWGYLNRKTLKYAREGWCDDGIYESIRAAEKNEHSPHEGLRPVCSGWDYGYQDQNGRWVIEPQFGMAGHFSESLAPVRVNDLWGVIDENANFVVEPYYQMIYEFSEGLAAFRLDDKYGFIDTIGRRTIDARFDDYGWQFDQGQACVGIGCLYGIIDRLGKFVTIPQFQKVGLFRKDLARIQGTNEKWGFIDRKGNLVIDLQFEDAGSFHSIG
jgi:hypothetical protein